MPIPIDTFFTVTPTTDFKSKVHSILDGVELFFYISDTNELRVQNFGGILSYTLALGARWCAAIDGVNLTHLYYADQTGQIFYIPYPRFGATVTPQNSNIGNAITFSVLYAAQSTPPAYMMMVDNGIEHFLYTAIDPAFQTPISSPFRAFSNRINQAVHVTRPNIAMHPLDTVRITVHCQQITASTGVSQVGFYVVKVPGLL